MPKLLQIAKIIDTMNQWLDGLTFWLIFMVQLKEHRKLDIYQKGFMNKIMIAALIAAGQLLPTKPATAITFNFSWTSEAPGLSLAEGSTGVHRAMGTLDINVMPGNSFTTSDVSNVNITVTDGTNMLNINNAVVMDFVDSTKVGVQNSISPLEVATINDVTYGHLTFTCLASTEVPDFVIKYPDITVEINSDTQQNLQNSFVLTEVPLDISSYLPIGFLAVVVGINQLNSWKNKNKKKSS
ncbi:MAG: hypothetical protein GDA44_04400 [Prochloron sp. SP5CPC1]|nr:hypothetical protein [Candidatus Paraprochloron terpiosi SP5CPC1]